MGEEHPGRGVRRVGRGGGGGGGGEGGGGRTGSRCQATRCGGDRIVVGRGDRGM